MKGTRGQMGNIWQLALGVGLFIFVLGIMGTMLGETQTAMDSEFVKVNNTLGEGIDAMETGSKFGPVLIILGILIVFMGAFRAFR